MMAGKSTRHAQYARKENQMPCSPQQRLASYQRRYQELLTTRVEQRLAQALVRLAEQIGRPQAGGILIDIPLTRADLAEYTGTTLFSVSRILRTWETQGLVESGRERVVVRDTAALADISDLDGVSFMGCALACGR